MSRGRTVLLVAAAALSVSVLAGATLGGWGRRTSHAAPLLNAERVQDALETYAEIAWASYSDAAAAWGEAQAAIDRLLADPSPETLAAARSAWLQARRPYLQTETFRFTGGPIDRVELLVNTWPIDESFIESAGGERAGIIDDVAQFPELSRALLVRLNGQEGETSISTGYHAIEFLLWGRDESELGPGDRPDTDFREGSPRAARRRSYLRLASSLLAEHLAEVRAAWAPGQDNYRARFLALPPSAALAEMLKGMGSLSGPELAGERLTVAYETRDPENEHSCFSDSTQQDVLYDALGIENLCLGRYQRQAGGVVSGLGVCTLLAEQSTTGAALRDKIAASVQAARALPNPFDRALAQPDEDPGRRAIAAAIQAFQDQAEAIARVAAELGLRARPR